MEYALENTCYKIDRFCFIQIDKSPEERDVNMLRIKEKESDLWKFKAHLKALNQSDLLTLKAL